jgi:hypothetical protein
VSDEKLVPIAGVAVSRPQPDGRWHLLFPVRKHTTAKVFSIGVIEDAARIFLYENIPEDWEVDESKMITIQWSEAYPTQAIGGPQMVFIHLTAYLKGKSDGSE